MGKTAATHKQKTSEPHEKNPQQSPAAGEKLVNGFVEYAAYASKYRAVSSTIFLC